MNHVHRSLEERTLVDQLGVRIFHYIIQELYSISEKGN